MKIKMLTAAATSAALIAALTACSSGNGSDGGSLEGATITYWATNQGPTIEDDKRILQPELDKFREQTGITVELEVVPWADLINNQLSAAVSGQGPDVSNLGNTNATTLQTTGAWHPFTEEELATIGADKFVESALATAGPEGTPPTSLPLYSQVYGLFYNKQLFEDAGLEPPATWQELVDAAKTLNDPSQDRWGVVMPAGTVNVNMHMAYILTSQLGGSPFDAEGNPDFTNDAMVQGVKKYVDLMATDKVMNPSVSQYTDGGGPALADFAAGRAAMVFGQTSATGGLASNGMEPDAYGVVPIPAPPDGNPKGDSFVAGTNISIFNETENLAASLEFVKFMTSPEEQEILNGAYGTLPVVKDVVATAYEDDEDQLQTWTDILANHAQPLSLVPNVSAYQTNVGGALVSLFGRVSAGQSVSEADVRAALEEAQQKMGTPS